MKPVADARYLITTIIMIIIVIIIIMEICKAPTLGLRVLNKRSIKHTWCMEMENVMRNLTKKLTHNVDVKKGSA